jgi:ketosteroid isomerase-like protein/DNA-binding XRE family transcriptional regulator
MRGISPHGDAVRRFRKELGLTQEALAQQAACDVKTVRHAERGIRVDAATVNRIADALRQPLAAIIAPDSGAPAAQRNIELFWTWQTASNARDVEGMVRCYHDDATMHIIGAEGLPGGGKFRGRDAIRRQWQEALEAFETEQLTKGKLQVDAVGDYVFVRATATGVVRATGAPFTSPGIIELLIQDGKIRRHTIAVDTGAIRRSMGLAQ